MAAAIQTVKVDKPLLARHDPSVLDLAFAMDCTGSMGAYINSARDNIRSIVEEIVKTERSNVRLALVEYRDHPPQEHTFVTRVNGFTDNVNDMKAWLDNCQANGGGDTPEAVADALHDVLKLSWRAHATKICVLISDAPPHGLSPNSDSFPKGCPAGFDPLKIVREMAENYITLYTVGVEPSIIPYREFFMSIAYITGGQYVPMVSAKCLAQVIIGGVREEISLESLMLDAQQEIAQEMKQADADGVDEKEKARRVKVVLAKKGKRVRQMRNKKGKISDAALDLYSKCGDMVEMKKNFTSKKPSPTPKAAASIDVDTDYELMEEEEVTVEQAQRIVQKFQNRARAAAGGPVTRQKLKETEDNA